MNDIPDTAPEFGEPTIDNLANTIQGLCNESTLSRAEIIGTLEAVKMALWRNWRLDDEEED